MRLPFSRLSFQRILPWSRQQARTISVACLAMIAMSLTLVLVAQQPGQDGRQPNQRQIPKGRLPAHYSKVVTPQQRYRIYYIQHRYQQAISKVEMQLDWLKQARDQEITNVLTVAQRTRLEQLRLEANRQNNPLLEAAPVKQPIMRISPR